MRVAFAGTPAFAAAALDALIAAGHDIALVLTQPDRPAGRGMALQPSAVKRLALRHGLPIHQPDKLRSEEARAPLAACAPDLLVVAAYGLILPQDVLAIPRLGCVNIHASLLPRWRGAAPIQRAILAGDTRTGITIMQMDAGLDTGPMLLAESIAIAAGDSAGTLHDKLAALGARLIVAALDGLAAGTLAATPQPGAGVTYADKVRKDEARLDWSRPAAELANQVRAFDPAPGALTTLAGAPLKIWRARVADGRGAPGSVLRADRQGIEIACGEHSLTAIELQKAGGRRLTAADFLSGTALPAGTRLGD